ncbi:MAG: sporulation protein YunB [Oscillospiraceae bacterium]|nr:sporulation protein YunB [Oscillospiraceae bacterium]
MRRKRWLWLLILLAAAFLRIRVNPLAEELALARITDAASGVINRAVSEQIELGNVQYENLMEIQRDGNGNIAALTTNMREMNRLKTGLLTILDDDLYNIGDDEIGIPLGNLTGIQLLSGRGPTVPVKIVAVSSSDASFRGEFTDAGINQTMHKIMMDVSLDLIVLLPSGSITAEVSTEVCVAETVLLGAVPGNYTYFSSGSDDNTGYFATRKGSS